MGEVTFWELFTNGKIPYVHMKSSEVHSRLAIGDLKPRVERSWPIADILEMIFEENKLQNLDAKELYRQMMAVSKC